MTAAERVLALKAQKFIWVYLPQENPDESTVINSARPVSLGLRVQNVQFLAWLEAHRATRRNRNLGPRPRISSDPRFPGPHVEYAKATQFYALTFRQRMLQTFEDRIHGMLGLVARQAGTFNHSMNYVLLDHFSTSMDSTLRLLRCYRLFSKN
jgi:hypothetical protein